MWREILIRDPDKANVGLFGISVDENASIERGAGLAPAFMREKSEYLPPYAIDGTEIRARVFDYGDVLLFDYGLVQEKLKDALKTGFAVVLGGDHSVSILSQKAFREQAKGRVGLIHIDAHADICDVYDSSKISHACVNRRALENGYAPTDMTMIGIRSYERQEAEFLAETPIEIFSADAVRKQGTERIIQRLTEKYADYDSVYLSFDIDAVDPAYAPGTGTPEAFGMTSLEALRIITAVVEALPVRVMDIVEVSPPLDTNCITVWLALKYLLEVFKIISEKNKGENT